MKCTTCKRDDLKPSDFYQRGDTKGLRSECKKCTVERKRKYRQGRISKRVDRFLGY